MLNQVQSLVGRYPDLETCAGDIESAFFLLRDTFWQRGKVLVCGNGGSAADAEHIVGELMKGYLFRRPLPEEMVERFQAHFPDDAGYLTTHLQGALPAIALVSHSALITAFSNDVAPEMIFAQQVYGYGRTNDTLIALSTSGSSANILRALQVARVSGLATIGLTGRSGGRMKALCDVTICVPHDSTPLVQERHLPIYHALCAMLEAEFFGA